MNITIFQADSKINYADDLLKVAKFFKDKINLDIKFSSPILTDVKIYEAPWKLYVKNDNGQQDMLMYIFDRTQRVKSHALNFSKNLQVIEISTATFDDAVDYTWKLISHEIVHTFFNRLKNIGIYNLEDPMDSMLVNGIMMPYYKNEDPYASDGNFAAAFKILSPHLNKIFPAIQENYFKTEEFVPKSIYQQYGENSKWFIDPRIIKLANFTRKFFNKSVTINNWLWGGTLDERGFRDPASSTGGKLSQHRFGRAIDINVASMTPKAVYEAILANKEVFMEAGLTCMEDINDTPTWCHLDIRWTGEKNIKIVKP